MSKRSSSLFFFLLLAATVSAVYSLGLHNDLVFDDARLTDGTIFGQYGKLLELKRRMLSYGSFVWVQELFGDGWWKQRLVNVLLHLATSAGLYVLFRDLLASVELPQDAAERQAQQQSRALALKIAVLLFAVNPVAVYAVGYLVQRSTEMACFWVVLACLGLVRGLRGAGIQWLGLALMAYVLAVASKESAVTAVALVVPLYVFVARPGLKRALGVSAVALVLLGAVVAMLYQVLGSVVGHVFDENSRFFAMELDKLQPGIAKQLYPLSIVNQMALYFYYGFLWFIPNVAWMSIDMRPAFPLSLLAMPQIVGAIVFLALLGASAWQVIRRADLWGFAALCVLMSQLLFFTEFATVWLQDPFVLYRSYLWALAIPGLVALMLMVLPVRAMYVAGVLLVGLYGALAVERVMSFETELSVWSDAADKIDLQASANAVGRWRPFMNRGSYYQDHSSPDLAYDDFVRAAKLGEPYGSARFSMGMSQQVLRQCPEALKSFDAAAAMGFNEPTLYFQRGEALYGMGRMAEAFDSYSKALSMPQSPEAEEVARFRRAAAAIPAQKFDEAIQDYTTLLSKKPDDLRLKLGLGMAYVGKHQTQQAIAQFDAVLAVREVPPAYFGRGLAYAAAGDKAAALRDLDKAIALAPNNTVYKANRERIAGAK